MALSDNRASQSGYCYLCDTVYDKPHECVSVGKQMNKKDNLKESYYSVCEDGSIIHDDSWNAAIEAAAKEASQWGDYEETQIRALKK